jgi:integrase
MPPDFRRLARGALYTGLRLGELLALCVADVPDGQVHIRHSKSGAGRTVFKVRFARARANRKQMRVDPAVGIGPVPAGDGAEMTAAKRTFTSCRGATPAAPTDCTVALRAAPACGNKLSRLTKGRKCRHFFKWHGLDG